MPNNLIVYCPGYSGMPPAKYNPLLRRFSKEGYDTVSINYKLFGRGDIETTVKRTLKVIEPLRQYYDHISLIGHSMGGLVARKALCANASVADSLVTIATPHRGTQAAMTPLSRIFGGRALAQMRPESEFLTSMTKLDIPVLTISAQWDLLVKDASLTGVKNVEIPYTEHFGIIAAYPTFGEIFSWLTYDILDSLPSYSEGGKVQQVEVF